MKTLFFKVSLIFLRNTRPKAFAFLYLFINLIGLIPAFAANDAPQTFTLDGQLFQSGTTHTLLDSSVKIDVQIIDPSGKCVLYEEAQTVNTLATDGYFHLNVGSATGSSKRTVNDPGRTMAQVFQNISAITANSVSGQTCVGGSYTPTAGAVRYFRLTVTPSSTGTSDILSPDLIIDSVPQAMVAQSVQGLERVSILQTNNTAPVSLNQANLEALFTTPAYGNLQAILNGNFMKSDAAGAALPGFATDPAAAAIGDVWYDTTTNQVKYLSNTGVQIVGASSGGAISSLSVGSSMSMNGSVAGTISNGSGTIDLSNTGITAGTYTKLTVDAKGRATAGTVSLIEADIPNLTLAGKVSGNTITSGTISGSAGINTTGNLITTGTVSGLTVQATNLRVYNGANYVQMTAGTISGNVSFTLPTGAGSAGQILSTDGNGVMSWINPTVIGSLGGDVSGALGSNTVQKIQGKSITAGSVSGQVMIYDGTQWVNSVVSGDATLSYAGVLSLNKVPVSKGGTNTTSYGNNHIIVSNGTGSALVDATCSLNQVLSFDASGYAVCSNVSSLLVGAIVNGGNTTGADISIGTNDNKALAFKVNNATAMTISQNGYVGVGTATPGGQLEVRADNTNTTFLLRSGYATTSRNPTIMVQNHIDAATGGYGILLAQNARGNASGRLAMNSGDTLGHLEFSGHNGTAFQTGASINAVTSQAWTGSAQGTRLEFATTANGATSTATNMVLNQSGYLGIGTTTPATALDVSGAITAEGMSAAPSVSTAGTGRLYYDYSSNKFKVSQNGGAYVDLISAASTTGFLNAGNAFGGSASLGTTDNNSLSFLTNNTTAMTISQSGYVGIGTTSPSGILQVAGGTAAAATNGTNITITAQSAGTGNQNGGNIVLAPGSKTGTGVAGGVLVGTSTNPGWMQPNSLYVAGYIYAGGTYQTTNGYSYAFGTSSARLNGTGNSNTTDYLSLTTNSTERARMDGSGNFGIGTPSPTSALDVSGAITAEGMSSAPSVSTAGTGRLYYDYATNKFKISQNGGAYVDLVSATGGAGDIINGGNTTGADISIGTNDNKALAFKVNNATAMTISQSGNVGIGTTTPQAKLDVTGGQAIGTFYDATASASLDMNNGNMQTTSAAAGTITLTNMKAGGTYTLIFTNATGGTYTLSATGYSFRCQPNCPSSQFVVNAGTHTVLTIVAASGTAYVGWMRGF